MDGKFRDVVIGALDEIKKEWLPDMLRLIADYFSKLPPYIRIIITSRDEAAIKKALLTIYKSTELRCNPVEKRNKQDVKAHLEHIVRENEAAVAPRDLEREVKKKVG